MINLNSKLLHGLVESKVSDPGQRCHHPFWTMSKIKSNLVIVMLIFYSIPFFGDQLMMKGIAVNNSGKLVQTN